MAGYYTRSYSGVLYVNGSKRSCNELKACECGGRPMFRTFRGKVFISCDSCPKSTGFVSATLYNEDRLHESWNKLSSIPWRDVGKNKERTSCLT